MVSLRHLPFVRSWDQVKGNTHFICFPILAPHSKPIIRDSLSQLYRDPAFPFPEYNIRPLGTLHIPLAPLALGSPERFAHATRLLSILSMLDIKRLLKAAETNPPEQLKFDEKYFLRCKDPITLAGNSYDPSQNGITPIHATLSGLHAKHEARAFHLDVRATDASGRLGPLWLAIEAIYRSANFYAPNPKTRLERHKVTKADAGASQFRVRIVGSLHDIKVLSRTQQGKKQHVPSSIYNVEKLLERHEDRVWAEEVHIDRVSICKLGLSKTLRKEDRGGLDSDLKLEEEFSVSLP